jgi:hypothetical protein
MPDNEKDDFYGVSEEEIEAVRKQRIAREQEADLLLKSAQAIRKNGTDMRKIRTPHLDRMRAQLRKIKQATRVMALISIIASIYFALPHYIVKDLIEDYKYGKLTEEEKQLKNQQVERQRYDGKTWDELTEQEQDYYIEYYRQKEMQEDEEVRKYGYTKESAKEYDNDLIKHLVPSWAPTIFMLFLYLGYKKRGGEHEQAAADAANFMLDWAEMGADYAINPKMLKHIMSDRFAREIIAGMSEAESIWFEMLLDGNVELADTPEFKNMAIAVMQNYLTRHPEAIVKLLEKYDRDAIPQELMPGHVPTSRSYGR